MIIQAKLIKPRICDRAEEPGLHFDKAAVRPLDITGPDSLSNVNGLHCVESNDEQMSQEFISHIRPS